MQTKIKVKGMSCQHCVAAVTKALKEIAELEDVVVDLEKGEASFREKGPVSKEVIREKIKKAGYEAEF
jgi:copper chaperone